MHAKQWQAAHEPEGEDDVGELLDLGLPGDASLVPPTGALLSFSRPHMVEGERRAARAERHEEMESNAFV